MGYSPQIEPSVKHVRNDVEIAIKAEQCHAEGRLIYVASKVAMGTLPPIWW